MNEKEHPAENSDDFQLLQDEKLMAADGLRLDESVVDASQGAEFSGEREASMQENPSQESREATDASSEEIAASIVEAAEESTSEEVAADVELPRNGNKAAILDAVAEIGVVSGKDTSPDLSDGEVVTPPEKKPLKPAKPLKPVKKSAKPVKADKGSKLATKSSSSNAKKRSTKKRIVWAIIVAVFIVVVVGAFLALQNLGIPVTTARVETGDVAITVFATGAVTPGETRDVYPETQGIIEAVRVSPGDIVERGDILATLDSAASRAQLSQAEAALAQARSGLTQAESARTQASSGITAAQSSLDAANASLTSAQNLRDLSSDTLSSARRTVRNMENSGAATADPAAFAQAQAAVTQAEIGLEQARGGVAQANAGVAQARAALDQARALDTASPIDAAQAGITAAEDGVALAEAALEATIIRAPKDGMVLFAPTAASAAAMGTGITPTSGIEIMPGSAVAPGSPLFTVVEEDTFSFTAEVDEIDIRRIELGQAAEVTLLSYSGRVFPATVSDISQLAKPTATGGTVFEVELSLAEDVSDLRIGMRGDTVIEIETQFDVLTIPIDAWFSEAGTDFVYLINDENVLVKTPITVGASTEFVVEVLEGLDEGDTLAMASGPIPLEDGSPVTTVP